MLIVEGRLWREGCGWWVVRNGKYEYCNRPANGVLAGLKDSRCREHRPKIETPVEYALWRLPYLIAVLQWDWDRKGRLEEGVRSEVCPMCCGNGRVLVKVEGADARA